jgi:hypothetical protein
MKSIKAWAVVRMSDLDMAGEIFRSRRKATQYRNDTLRQFLKAWPTSGRRLREFVAMYSVVPIEIRIKAEVRKTARQIKRV